MHGGIDKYKAKAYKRAVKEKENSAEQNSRNQYAAAKKFFHQ